MNKRSKAFTKYRILITPKEACESLSRLPDSLLEDIDLTSTYGRVDEPGKLISFLQDKDAVVLDLEPITSGMLESCRGLKVISRFGEGCDSIDLESARRFGVRVTRTRAVSSTAVARHTLALILSLTHRITENDRNLKKGLWLRKPNISEEAITLGVVGFGRIGQALADLAAMLGFKILLYNRTTKTDKYPCAHGLEEIIKLSDIISLHLPLTAETSNIISGDILRELAGKYLVNTARGGLVDEGLLLEALKRGEIAGYATDVFSNEPVSDISRELAGHPNVVCSPHIAALDKITAINMTKRALENAVNCLNNNHERVNLYVE
ncbi:MAG: NAD(P)-dependent oxidoreductase [Candidatus Omnitrophica bacterium]|nr:NAD(P)-dependent oxidoreductase [Candidatus Omnitrophota bacterium]